ncbi:MAG: hypothetical protein LC104_18320 [Bacteroidales bacterium]|nr:hypothetical protein [Bacteroidales bacterium]
MYPSGVWEGFWQQNHLGRQAMVGFHLRFDHGTIDGMGSDMVGRFLIHGEYEQSNGHVRFVKQYLNKHAVLYVGQPDGEGSILGTWTITNEYGGRVFTQQGPFGLRPVLPRPTGAEPIQEIGG